MMISREREKLEGSMRIVMRSGDQHTCRAGDYAQFKHDMCDTAYTWLHVHSIYDEPIILKRGDVESVHLLTPTAVAMRYVADEAERDDNLVHGDRD